MHAAHAALSIAMCSFDARPGHRCLPFAGSSPWARCARRADCACPPASDTPSPADAAVMWLYRSASQPTVLRASIPVEDRAALRLTSLSRVQASLGPPQVKRAARALSNTARAEHACAVPLEVPPWPSQSLGRVRRHGRKGSPRGQAVTGDKLASCRLARLSLHDANHAITCS